MSGDSDTGGYRAAPVPHAAPRTGRVYTPEQLRVVERLRRLAYLLDARFRVPGTNIRVGLDGLLGLFPGIGDTATLGLSLHLIVEAQKLGVSRATTARMIGNVAIDYVVGLIPGLGDLFDIAFKANIRNLRLIGIEVGPAGR